MVSLDKYTTQYTMLNAPKDTGNKIRAYSSILLAPPVGGAIGWGASLTSFFLMLSNLGPRRLWRGVGPVGVLGDGFSGTVGVEGGAGGVVFEAEDEVAAFDWLAEQGLRRDWLEKLLVPSEVEDDWLVKVGLDAVAPLLLDVSVLWGFLGSGWDWRLELTRFRKFPLVSEFCCWVKGRKI